jgi:hypothetical protein
MEARMKYFYCLLMAAALLLIDCSKDKTTQPSPQGTLLINKLVVSMVPNGNEMVTIYATKGDGTPDNCTIENSDPSIVSAALTDSVIQITGLSSGVSNITVRSGSGKNCIIPVQVYSPYILETSELLITFVDQYTLRWRDWGSEGTYDGSFYHPVTTDGFRAIGSLACGPDGYPDPNGTFAIMVVKAKLGHEDALAEPVSYQLIYNDRGSGATMYGSFWRPIPPDGYVAMGTVAANNTWDAPSLSDVVCVRSDLAVIGEASTNFIYTDLGTGADMYLSCWKIEQPGAGPHELAYLQTGTFVGVNNWNRPTADPAMYVLKVDLPTLAEVPYQTFVPTLASYDAPPEETIPIMAKAMLVPCTIINDAAYSGNIGWQVAHSPLYRLERQVFYKLLYHNHNQTSTMQTNNVTITSGITTEQSTKIWSETSISVAAEVGISFKAFEGKITSTVSRSFGYETQTSVAELQQKSISSSINTPPGKAAALWQRYSRYILYRHNGTQYEPVTSWEFGIDSYVTDQYPNN